MKMELASVKYKEFVREIMENLVLELYTEPKFDYLSVFVRVHDSYC